ncbi:Predicted membrane protein (DUF2207) [Propionibacterium australiense]|uniref:DUF2207 domain-containing protein n=2 Tax=Propionibacterium australiense TaxID=119981 RepID=A0A383S344_9ACTN|nr:DUF2207 domain-containing protein [Propionibacterium australiense]RLP08907.1 DUF2207 domain-containing protein [Propionibacterium australiense]RLP11716.1 DUF2207 domain-containing protein [Propionibacterium australiense]SYZ32458.1 Predicted membrane protein (DUF2207) [Propionibacterium australiense]VEH90171.1 Predicted membrane protein (DUF2207) [Propionibacterium australiense]
MRRTPKALVVFVLGLLVLVASWSAPQAAVADTSDRVDSWRIDYTVDPDGLLHVSETLVWRFGSGSGRHGIERDLLVREPWGEDGKQDVVYEISDIAVSSPDASARFTTRTSGEREGERTRHLVVTIGDRAKRITSATATYTISYTVAGALRTSGDYDELYWDALGPDTPPVNDLRVNVDVPGGAQQVVCFAGPIGSADACDAATISNGTARFTHRAKASGENLTIGVMIAPGRVSDNQPHLEKAAVSTATRTGWQMALAGTLSSVLGALGVYGFARKRRDERFTGAAPGAIPEAPERAATEKLSRRARSAVIPVQFAPPQMPVAMAGLLIDGRVGARETTATIVDLAVRGVLQLRSDDGIRARLVNPGLLREDYERQLVADVFGTAAQTTDPRWVFEKRLDESGQLEAANKRLSLSVAGRARTLGLLKHAGVVGETGRTDIAIAAAVMVCVMCLQWILGVALFQGMNVLTVLPGLRYPFLVGSAVVPLAVVYLIGRKVVSRRGQRTALGSALTDQAEGFREYLGTAEADQIRFEEGQDIFGQYLPWAIVFDLTDRWAQICERLVDTGRIAPAVPSWYYGNPAGFSRTTFARSVGRVNRTGYTRSGTGYGSGRGGGTSRGSSFRGGGRAGRGGGGGGARGW